MSVDTDVMARSSNIQSGDIQKMLRDAFAVALAGRRLIAGTAIMAAVLAVLGFGMVQPSFTAVLIVGPTATEGLLGRGTPLPDLPAGSLVNGAVHGAGERMSYLSAVPLSDDVALRGR